MSKGARNLIILGGVACLIAVITTGIELIVYRNSGDIYLDRSRPGFLPDEDEVEANHQDESTYSYPDTGNLDANELDKYLEELQLVEAHIKRLADPYGPSPCLTNRSVFPRGPNPRAKLPLTNVKSQKTLAKTIIVLYHKVNGYE